ncbi:MAG: AAA family ATPase [Calditrichaceae bacterium]|nr:AAA family ATPase [Calditrichaceae bacterium]
MKTLGLTLGKFAPFHKGHEFLIETAIKETDEVIVVIYDSPEITSIPLNVRANWIRKIFPQIEVIEGWDGPSDSGNTPEIMKVQENYINELLNGRQVTHFYSSEFYGDHMSRSLNAQNRIVDEKRKTVSISGTDIRNNPYQNRKYLSSIVYEDLVVNVVFLGAPSTGKSTIAEDCAKEFKTVYMPEYGREYWEKNQKDRRLSLEQLVEIAEEHLKRENKLIQDANKYLFTDTNAITTYMFSKYYHNDVHEKLLKYSQEAEKRYDIFFLCDTDIPYDDTWDRSGETNREIFQKQIIADLKIRKVPYYTLIGTKDERMNKVKSILSRYHKFSNITEL